MRGYEGHGSKEGGCLGAGSPDMMGELKSSCEGWSNTRRNANMRATDGMWSNTCLQVWRRRKTVLGNTLYPAEGTQTALSRCPGDNSN